MADNRLGQSNLANHSADAQFRNILFHFGDNFKNSAFDIFIQKQRPSRDKMKSIHGKTSHFILCYCKDYDLYLIYLDLS